MIKSLLFNLIVFIVAASSLQAFHFDINFSDEGDDVLSSLPLIKMVSLRSPDLKSSRDTDITLEKSFEIFVLRILTSIPTITLLHYLPVYSLNRVGDYFLLI